MGQSKEMFMDERAEAAPSPIEVINRIAMLAESGEVANLEAYAKLKRISEALEAALETVKKGAYNELEKYIDRLVINHSKAYSKGIVHINTIEGFWSQVKNGIRGSYKVISKKYLPLYLVEFEWKWNNRNYRGDEFEKFLKNALDQEKELLYWKAKSKEKVKRIAYE
jgi:transposase-like protein